MLLPLGLLISLTGTASASSADSASQVGQELPRSNLAIPTDTNSPYARELWRAEISIAQSQKTNTSKNRLRQAIEQIRAVEFKQQSRAPKPVVVADEIPATEPNETVPDTTTPKEQETQIETRLPYKPVTEQTLRMLRELSQHPEKLDNPFELGEILFLSGNLKEAATFYQEALNRRSPGDMSSAQDRAWILFQIGNCLRGDDRATAAKMYAQLVTEYPNSPWTDLAEAQGKLIDWYQKDEPRKLISEMERVGSEQGQDI